MAVMQYDADPRTPPIRSPGSRLARAAAPNRQPPSQYRRFFFGRTPPGFPAGEPSRRRKPPRPSAAA